MFQNNPRLDVGKTQLEHHVRIKQIRTTGVYRNDAVQTAAVADDDDRLTGWAGLATRELGDFDLSIV